MKHLFPLIVILSCLFISSCANQGSPQGGPRDTIPPILIKSIPENKSLNYTNKVFQFEFDERISADQLTSKLNITPRTENKFKVFIKKHKMTMTFEDNFEDSTTYTLNFADGVGDLTEKNPVENFSFAFSTGPVIDSISINGNVKNLYNNEIEENILIALFDIDDTLNLFTGKPKYFTKTNKAGQYKIENIKNGYYKLYAFLDDNNNLINEPTTEPHGFLSDSIDLNTSKDSVLLKVQLLDASEPKFVRAKTTGPYFDALYNKYCKSYTITKVDTTNHLNIPPNGFYKENTIIRFYKDETFQYDADSLQLVINFSDSLQNQLSDTVFVKFKESKRKPEEMTMKVSPAGKDIDDKLTLKFNFSKPIEGFIKDSIIVKYDTLKTVHLPDSLFTWNQNRTQLSLSMYFDKDFIPKAKAKIDSLQELISLDTVNTDSLEREEVKELSDTTSNNLKRKQSSIKQNTHRISNKIRIYVAPATFISVDNDSTEVKKLSYGFREQEEYGLLRGTVKTDKEHYFLQLTNPNYKVIQQIKSPKNFQFNNVEPGKYTFRILIDSNGDGKWSPGNILKDIEPEPTWFYSENIDLRANWEVENLYISF